MPRYFGTLNRGDIFAEFSDNFVLDDYGVPGSPRFWTPTGDTEIVSLSILGEDLDLPAAEKQVQAYCKIHPEFRETPLAKFVLTLADAIYQLADEVEYDQSAEPDYDE